MVNWESPIVALSMVVILVLILRWISPTKKKQPTVEMKRPDAQSHSLVPVTGALPGHQLTALGLVLAGHGIGSTISAIDGGRCLSVHPADHARADDVLRRFHQGRTP